MCIAVALKYGAEVGIGAFEAVLPTVKVDELLRKYQMSVPSHRRTASISSGLSAGRMVGAMGIDISRLGPAAQRQVLHAIGMVG